jgi:hypothetical protein
MSDLSFHQAVATAMYALWSSQKRLVRPVVINRDCNESLIDSSSLNLRYPFQPSYIALSLWYPSRFLWCFFILLLSSYLLRNRKDYDIFLGYLYFYVQLAVRKISHQGYNRYKYPIYLPLVVTFHALYNNRPNFTYRHKDSTGGYPVSGACADARSSVCWEL